jgi:hypothetical protein
MSIYYISLQKTVHKNIGTIGKISYAVLMSIERFCCSLSISAASDISFIPDAHLARK